MVKLTFQAVEHEPWQGAEQDSPATFALRMWLQFQNADEDMDLATACELALFDREVWDELQTWAWSQDMDALPEAAAAALGRALGRKPPRRGIGATARRNARLRAVAAALARVFGLPPTRGTHTGTALSASAILKSLPGMEMVEEKTIINTLTKSRPHK